MNPLNPRSVKDHARFEESLRTEFARQKFWKLRDSLGHTFWSEVQEAIEKNLKEGGNKRSVIATISRIRRKKLQNEWKNTLKRQRELKQYGRIMGAGQNKKQKPKSDKPEILLDEKRVIHVANEQFIGRPPKCGEHPVCTAEIKVFVSANRLV